MWIIPSSHPLYSASAQEFVASKEDLKELLNSYGEITATVTKEDGTKITTQVSQLPAMWRSSALSRQTWLLKWKQVYWLHHLFLRTLKASQQQSFEEKLIGYWLDFHVNPSLLPVTERERMTPDTFGRIYSDISAPTNLWDASLKTSSDSSAWDTEKFTKALAILVIKLSAEYTARKRLAHHIRGSAYSSLLFWKTPVSSENEGGIMEVGKNKGRIKLRDQSVLWGTPRASRALNGSMDGSVEDTKGRLEAQVTNWPTPTVVNSTNDLEKHSARAQRMKEKYKGKTGNGIGMNMATAIQLWPTPQARDHKSPDHPESGNYQRKLEQGYSIDLNSAVMPVNRTTPSARDWKDTPGLIAQREDGAGRLDQLPRQVYSLQDRELNNTIGSRIERSVRLNPTWSILLMGTTLQKTFTALLVIRLWSKQPRLHLLTSVESTK